MDAHNFNFATKFPQNEGYQLKILYFFGKKFSDKKKIFRQTKLSPCAPCPCATTLWLTAMVLYESIAYSSCGWPSARLSVCLSV